MKIGPFSLFKGCLAAWHWGWSITWRWLVAVSWHSKSHRLGWHTHRIYCGRGIRCGLNTPLVDIFFQSQPNMRRDKT